MDLGLVMRIDVGLKILLDRGWILGKCRVGGMREYGCRDGV